MPIEILIYFATEYTKTACATQQIKDKGQISYAAHVSQPKD
jgi:hypothetical protein